MKLNEYVRQYSEDHQNPVNIVIHKICVPAIMFSVLGLLKALPIPGAWPLWLDWSTLFVMAAMGFYINLGNSRVVAGIGVMLLSMLLVLEWLRPRFFILSLVIFIVAWIAQFIGHKIEGKKPSFFTDLFYLLIGPIWTLKALSDKIGFDLKIDLSNAKGIAKNP